MPYKLRKSGKGWKVANRKTGRTYSKKPMSKSKAKKQLAALHIHTNEAFLHEVELGMEDIYSDPEASRAWVAARHDLGVKPSEIKFFRRGDGRIFAKAQGKIWQWDQKHDQWDPAYLQMVPTMAEVFRIDEMLPHDPSKGPPPGSVKAPVGIWNQLGKAGKLAHDSIDAMNDMGTNDYDPMVTPDGQIIAYPKVKKPDQPPIRANLANGGLWGPVTNKPSGSGGM